MIVFECNMLTSITGSASYAYSHIRNFLNVIHNFLPFCFYKLWVE